MSNSGIVQLASGSWYWTLKPGFKDSMIVFQRNGRSRDEMEVWTTAFELTPEAAVAAARDAVARLWTDGFGRQWQLVLEQAGPRGSGQEPSEQECGWLVFYGGGRRLRVPVSARTSLADLPCATISNLLAEEENGSANVGLWPVAAVG